MAQYISVFSPVLNPSILMKAPSHPRNPSRRMVSSVKVPSRADVLPSSSSALARAPVASRVRNRTEYFPSATSDRVTGMPWAPVAPIMKIFEVACDDIAVCS
ncbi:Uncharacterised protein [Mycobacteroides abscessus subsp. abscessus]|nr:Uncharacterised protein [Mycobacteroides abscessus subsp. abscessus]